MKLLFLYTVLLSCISNSIFAQRHPGLYRNEIKTSITGPFTILAPTIELGYERYYRKNLSSEIAIGK